MGMMREGLAARARGAAGAVVVAAGVLAAAGVFPASAEDNEGPIIAVSGPLSWPFFAAVKSGFDEVGLSIGELDIERDIRITLAEGRECRCQVKRCQGNRRGQA